MTNCELEFFNCLSKCVWIHTHSHVPFLSHCLYIFKHIFIVFNVCYINYITHIFSDIYILHSMYVKVMRNMTLAEHGKADSFIELDKAVVHVIRLVSFLWLWFSFCLSSDGEGLEAYGSFLMGEHICGYWYFSQQSWFQLVLHPAWHFTWPSMHFS